MSNDMNEFHEEPDMDPEDCEACGCEAGNFEDSHYVDGVWRCPECGTAQ